MPKRTDSIQPRWFPLDESKAWGEKFFLLYSLFWMGWVAFLLITKLYEDAGRWGYFFIGFVIQVPCYVLPLIFPGKTDRNLPITQRWWFKANIWLQIFGFVGNYFWTHYFYRVLGAAYTMDTFRINDVPWVMFFCTQGYFTMYHCLTNIVQRRIYTTWTTPSWIRSLFVGVVIFILSYFTAFMETLTISSFPYYTHQNKKLMYVVGSVFYGIYFIVSFPMFYRMEENVNKPKWPLTRVIIDSLAASMLVTILLDLWRISIGGIVPDSGNTLPWL